MKPQLSAVPERFGLARHRPPGSWSAAAAAEPVVGTYHQIDNVRAFAAAVRRAERMGHRYGLRLARAKTGSDDQTLIVLGFAETQGMFGSRTLRDWRIGTLSRGLSEDVSRHYLDRNIPIAAELVSIVDVPDGAPMIIITILASQIPAPVNRGRPALTMVH